MQIGEVLHQVESDTTATERLHFRTVDLIESIEDMYLILIADALARVGDLQTEYVLRHAFDFDIFLHIQANGDSSAIRGELIGVAQQVVDDFAHLVNIKFHRQFLDRRDEHQLDLGVAQQLERTADTFHIRDRLHLGERQLATLLLYLPEVEDLIDQVQQTLRIAIDQLQLMFLAIVLFVLDHIGKRRDNQSERRAKFMAHIGEEVQLQFVEFPVLSDVLLHLLTFENHLLAIQRTLAIQIDCPTSQQQIYHESPDGKIERRMHVDAQLADFVANRTIAIHHFHLKGV